MLSAPDGTWPPPPYRSQSTTATAIKTSTVKVHTNLHSTNQHRHTTDDSHLSVASLLAMSAMIFRDRCCKCNKMLEHRLDSSLGLQLHHECYPCCRACL